MNKPKRHKSTIIQKLQQNRSAADFEKSKKRMMLAAKIADAKKAKGWSNGDMALELDQHDSVISKWLSGTHNFTTDTLFDIERVLDINLLNWDDAHPKEIVHKYEVSVSAKAADVIGASYLKNSIVKGESLHQYIAICGGMAVTSASTQIN